MKKTIQKNSTRNVVFIVAGIVLVLIIVTGLLLYREWKASFVVPSRVDSTGTILSHPDNFWSDRSDPIPSY